MRIQMAYVGSSLSAYGFRLLTSIVRKKNPDTACSFVMFYNVRSIAKMIAPVSETAELTDEEVGKIAKEFSGYDVLGIACMSEHAAPVKAIIAGIRKINPKVFIVWGGVHPIMHPGDAIEHADAICVSEAETAFPDFLEKFESGQDYTTCKSFWFRRGDQIIKNGFAQLLGRRISMRCLCRSMATTKSSIRRAAKASCRFPTSIISITTRSATTRCGRAAVPTNAPIAATPASSRSTGSSASCATPRSSI